MATFHINRSGTNLGTFSEDEVREGFRSGKFVGTDLGWREGMTKLKYECSLTDHETIAKAARPRLIIALRNLTALSRQVCCHHSAVSVDEITFACAAGIWAFGHSSFVLRHLI